MAHKDHGQPMKVHAQRRDVYRSHPLWASDEDDWQLMRNSGLPVGDLICPKEGCRAELVTVELTATGTRFLRNRPGTPDCGHAFGARSGGAEPLAEHRWFQQRLAMLCGDLGYEAIQEHYDSRADVWVDGTPPLAIEVQRWTTNFSGRTGARQSKGANVLWLLPESASSNQLSRELFRQPAARIRVLKRGSRTEEARPWEVGHSGRVMLWVGATVMRPSQDGLSLESAGNYDARKFLLEVLQSERQWYGPSEPDFAFGAGWARPDDVDQTRKRLDAQRRAKAVEPIAFRAETIRPVIDIPRDPLDVPPAEQPELVATLDVTPHPARAVTVETTQKFGGDTQPSESPQPTGWFLRVRRWFRI